MRLFLVLLICDTNNLIPLLWYKYKRNAWHEAKMQKLTQPRDLKKNLSHLSQTAAPALTVFSA
jgi:hypothetical protein